jgi:hypothetical protein
VPFTTRFVDVSLNDGEPATLLQAQPSAPHALDDLVVVPLAVAAVRVQQLYQIFAHAER